MLATVCLHPKGSSVAEYMLAWCIVHHKDYFVANPMFALRVVHRLGLFVAKPASETTSLHHKSRFVAVGSGAGKYASQLLKASCASYTQRARSTCFVPNPDRSSSQFS